uniref:Uncharacterized protein LOC111113583 n=1 Tax=Crassostrea virginica TaxID=6565 RepID=A0A8B8BXK6_CRAVI|nr:uncharacterized protein LOC111113583 [Crassostrea virginica]
MYILFIDKVSLSLLVHISALYISTGISQGDKNIPKEFSTKECELGFRQIKGHCKECIGFYGTNCGYPCEEGYFGEGCRSSCNCSAGQACNQFVGCIPSDLPGSVCWDCEKSKENVKSVLAFMELTVGSPVNKGTMEKDVDLLAIVRRDRPAINLSDAFLQVQNEMEAKS